MFLVHGKNFANLDNSLGGKLSFGYGHKHEKMEDWNNKILMTYFLPTVVPHAEGKLPEINCISLAL